MLKQNDQWKAQKCTGTLNEVRVCFSYQKIAIHFTEVPG